MVFRKILLEPGFQFLGQLGVVLIDIVVVVLHRRGQLLLFRGQVLYQVFRDLPQVPVLQELGFLPAVKAGGELADHVLYTVHLVPGIPLGRVHAFACRVALENGLLDPGGVVEQRARQPPGLQAVLRRAAEKLVGAQKAVLVKGQSGLVHAVLHQAVRGVDAPGIGPHVFHRHLVLLQGVREKRLGKLVQQGLGMHPFQDLLQFPLVLAGEAFPAGAGVHAAHKAF